jgi:23S rRNA (uridine2552-2'-O)-methyltransferase
MLNFIKREIHLYKHWENLNLKLSDFNCFSKKLISYKCHHKNNVSLLSNLKSSFNNTSNLQISSDPHEFFKFQKFSFSKQGSKEWLDRHTKDQYVKKSKNLDYRSRAAFKLIEINQKYKLLRPGQKVLDVGSAPGGWSQVIAELTKSSPNKPSAVAVDILRMDHVEGVHFIQGDMNKQKVQDSILEKNNYEKFDLVLSDMCPEFTGTKATDHANLIMLNQVTIEFAQKVLKRNGNFIMKTFEGSLQKKLHDGIRKYFKTINRFKPSSSRSESSEMFLVCMGYLENEILKKEAEDLAKMTPEEYFENQKKEVIKNYRLMKLNKLTLLEDLDKYRDEIISKYKIDPEKIKVDPKEEAEISKLIQEENDRLHEELHGRAYKPLPEDMSLIDYVQNYEKEMKQYDDKLRDVLKKEQFSQEEIDELLKEDTNETYQRENAQNQLKDIEYLQQKIDSLEKRITDEEAEGLLRYDGEENETLAKFKRWENILNDLQEDEKARRKMPSEETSIDSHDESKLIEEYSFI